MHSFIRNPTLGQQEYAVDFNEYPPVLRLVTITEIDNDPKCPMVKFKCPGSNLIIEGTMTTMTIIIPDGVQEC